MPKFRVVAGTYRTAEGERAEVGDVVDIDQSVYERHAETFAPVDADESDRPDGEGYAVETSDGADRESESETAPSATIPDDYRTLSSMAAEYEGDEVHGAMAGDDITEFFETLSDTELNALKRKAVTDGN